MLSADQGLTAKVLRLSNSSFGQWCAHEKQTFGFTHVELGVAVLERWNLPRMLVEAVALHHQDMQQAKDRPPTLAQLIWLSNQIAHSTASPWRYSGEHNWEQRFRQANITWPADQIAAFLNTF